MGLSRADASVAAPMKDWNVAVTVFPEGWRPAVRALRGLVRLEPSGHYNVLLGKVDDPIALLETLGKQAETEPVLLDTISRVAPALAVFDYETDEGFERQAMAAVSPWLARLKGKSFHVRVHRRGAGLSARGHVAEASLGKAVLDKLALAGAPGRIDFDDPDFVLAIDAIDSRAGLALWARDDLRRHRFLRPD